VSQEQRDREQAWVLTRGQVGHTANEHVEVLTDVEFFEQRVEQPVRQGETVGAFGLCAKVIETAVSSPVMNLVDVVQPGR
jgi:hypothetical protein